MLIIGLPEQDHTIDVATLVQFAVRVNTAEILEEILVNRYHVARLAVLTGRARAQRVAHTRRHETVTVGLEEEILQPKLGAHPDANRKSM